MNSTCSMISFILLMSIIVLIMYIKISSDVIKIPSIESSQSHKVNKKFNTNHEINTNQENINHSEILWNYICIKQTCKREIYKSGKRTSLKMCNMLCGLPQLWPYPKMIDHKNKKAIKFSLKGIHVSYDKKITVSNLVKRAYKLMIKNIKRLIPNEDSYNSNSILMDIKINKPDYKLLLNTSEEYKLTINYHVKNIKINLIAETFFGARHGLETLYQLIWWDDVEKSLMILININIFDAPAFPYRGLMLDTGNNYFSIKSIRRTLLGMAANKLNVFHWHITDTGSFPFESKIYPKLTRYGAYNDIKVYTQENIEKLVNFARSLGIRIIIEIDAPCHMLAGWESIQKNMVVFNEMNLNGEMNPNYNHTYKILNKLYEEIINITQEDELFHIGGHSLHIPLHRSSNSKTIHKLYDGLKRLNKTKHTILWSSRFTSENIELLNPSNTIIQLTEFTGKDIDKYGIIFSLESKWFLNCGLGSWSPNIYHNCYKYSTWQDIYFEDPWFKFFFNKIFGGEVVLWSEMVDEDSLDNTLWPRTAAFAENIWKANRIRKISPDVFTRLESQRERLEDLGLDCSVIWPEWCKLNPKSC